MLQFSSTGLNELHHLTQQAKSFIIEQDYILLSSITNSIRKDRSISEADYARLIDLIESYTQEGNLSMSPMPLSDSSESAIESTPTIEDEDMAHISLLNLRFFLLSYSGITNSPQTGQNAGLSLEHSP